MTADEVASVLPLLSLSPPTGFGPTDVPTEGELFEEASLGVLSARQSTNFRGHRQVTLGPEYADDVAALLGRAADLDAEVLAGASYTHVIFARPYRTAFTQLLTFVGHRPVTSVATVPWRAWRKRRHHAADIPTIAYLTELHVGILADAIERAVLIASRGKRRAQVFMGPFAGEGAERNQRVMRDLGRLCGMSVTERAAGWQVALVVQVGRARDDEEGFDLPEQTWSRLGANLLAFRSERIQPGVNQESSAPPEYQQRQPMDVDEAFVEQVGRAVYNGFARWTGVTRESAKSLMLLERIDVLSEGGKARLREIRRQLEQVTDQVVANIPKWVDLPTGRMLSRNAERGRKAFALAGQRIYVVGLSAPEITGAALDWAHAIRAVGAASARGALYAELMGVVDLPPDCDLLAGICMMAGPVNQNDVGKTFYGMPDLLESAHPGKQVSSLLVWTLKAKTVADPIGNEEQLLSRARKGALVDLRPGPHEVVQIRRRGESVPMRAREGRVNDERAFAAVDNFVRGADGSPIVGNEGTPWPEAWRNAPVW